MGDAEGGDTKSRRRWWPYILLGLLLVLVLALIANKAFLSRCVEAELEALRADGYPTTFDELEAWYPEPPPGENAADLYLKAFSLYAEPAPATIVHPADWPGGYSGTVPPWRLGPQSKLSRPDLPYIEAGYLPPPGEPIPEDLAKAIADCLNANKDCLAFLHQAAALEHSRHAFGPVSGNSYIACMRSAQRLLSLSAFWHAANGDTQQAAESVCSAFGLARSLEQEPHLISQLVRVACQAIAVNSLRDVLERTSFPDAQLGQMSKAVRRAACEQSMCRGVVGRMAGSEFSLGNSAFSAFVSSRSSGTPPVARRVLWHLYVASGARERDKVRILETQRRAAETCRLPVPERWPAANVLSQWAEQQPNVCVLTRMYAPGLQRAITEDLKGISLVTLAETALAVERYRLAHQALPERLADLVPQYMDAVPLDPFDGNPLRYTKLDKGYVIYGVGEDGKDDGGDQESYIRPDICFRVER